MTRGTAVGEATGGRVEQGTAAGALASTREHPLVERVRALCTAFPGTTERLSHGEPAWFAGGRRMFVAFADHHHDHRVALWAAALDGVQRHLLEDAPTQFFTPPYYGTRGWVGVRLDRRPDWDRVEVLVEESWRCVAGPRLVRAYETRP